MEPTVFDAEGNICIVNVSKHIETITLNSWRHLFILEHGGCVETVCEVAQRRTD